MFYPVCTIIGRTAWGQILVLVLCIGHLTFNIMPFTYPPLWRWNDQCHCYQLPIVSSVIKCHQVSSSIIKHRQVSSSVIKWSAIKHHILLRGNLTWSFLPPAPPSSIIKCPEYQRYKDKIHNNYVNNENSDRHDTWFTLQGKTSTLFLIIILLTGNYINSKPLLLKHPHYYTKLVYFEQH